MYRSCLVTFVGSNTHVDLVTLEMVEFDVILGTTDRRGGLIPKHLDSENLVTEIDSLNFTTEWQDRPSQS